jgi:hypothetical protein
LVLCVAVEPEAELELDCGAASKAAASNAHDSTAITSLVHMFRMSI